MTILGGVHMTTKTLYPRMDYESNGRQYILSAYTFTRNYSIGDAGFVRIDFPVVLTDKATNMIYAEVTYNILETSFEKEIRVDKIDKHQDTIDYIVRTEGDFVEPEPPQPPKDDIVFELLDRLMKYLENNK